MPKFHLISFNLCPFVQRSVITLLEKDIPFETTYIDLANKPDWFLEISPFGKVPVLKVDDDTVLFESAVINEYIDEVTPGRMLPEDPLRRALNRAWIEFASALAMDNYKLMVAPDEAAARAAATSFTAKLKRFEEQIGEGPLFNGSALSLVDTAAAPILQRTAWCEEIEPSLQITQGLPKVEAWRDALLARPSVQKSLVPNIREIFVEYLQGRGSPSRKAASSWLGQRATK